MGPPPHSGDRHGFVPYYACDGPEAAAAVVLASSLGTGGEMWEPQLPALRQQFRVIRIDMRGHGRSPAPPGPYELADLGRDVLAVLDGLGVPRAAVCGVSLGGMVGMWLAAHAPERIDRMVVCCSSPYLPPAENWRERARTVLRAGATEPIADAVVDRWLTPGYAAAHPDVRAWLRSMVTACDPQGYAACCGAIERMDLRGDLPGITAPTLVVAAAEDLATPPEHGEAIAAGIPGARLSVLGGGAHIASVERSEEVTRLIVAHLREGGSRGMA